MLEKKGMFHHWSAVLSLSLRFGLIVADDPQLIILISDHVYDDYNGNIYKFNIPHMNISRIPVNVVSPVALDYDHTEGLIYFTDIYTKQIRRVDINGGNEEEVAKFNSTSSPEGLTLDPKTRQVFYTDYGNNLIGRVEMDNFNHTVIVDTGLDKPQGIVADTKNKMLYWVNFLNDTIETSDYEGGQRSTVIYSDVIDPLQIAIDGEGRLYWTEFKGFIESASVTGFDRRRTAGSPSHMSIFNGFMYFTNFDSYLVAMSLDHIPIYATLPSDILYRPQGIHAFSPNFEVKVQCPYGKYGRDCSTCGACKNGTVCEKTTGICLGGCQPGYTTETCTEKCIPGTFGEDCVSQCSDNCKWNATCDFMSGKCLDGCQSGWKGENCTEECIPGTFGQNCGSQCSGNCKSNTTCDFMSGKCPDGCQSGWKGDSCTERGTEQNESPSIGQMAGVVLGVVAAIIIVVVAVCVIRRKREHKQKSDYFSGFPP